jgi:arylsulfatase A-like enzyme
LSRALAALLLLLLGCAAEPHPNVVLIVVDTLRRDALGHYGAPPDSSPRLDAFAEGAVRFERAYASAPWTLASVASMLTGLHPVGHGVLSPHQPLLAEATTLPEVLAGHGYATGGVVSHVALGRKGGLAQGLERLRTSHARGHDYISTEGVTQQAMALLREFAAGGRPFFLFVHYFDPHYNYRDHAEIDFAGPPRGRIDGSEEVMDLQKHLDELGPADVELLRALYREEVRHTDAGIGRLLDALDELGLTPSSVVAVTADHGEEFMERGWLGHIRTLYDELTHVPFWIRAPGAAPRDVEQPVSLVSITPTLLDLAGVEAGDLRFQAPSLADVVRGRAEAPPDPVLTEVDFVPVYLPSRRTAKAALVSGRFKVIRDALTGRLELYDLLDDPQERSDLAALRPQLAARLAAQLDDRLRRYARHRLRPAPRQLSPEEAELLRGLGYAGEEP